MAVESEEFAELSDEFALVRQTAVAAGLAGGGPEAPPLSGSSEKNTPATKWS